MVSTEPVDDRLGRLVSTHPVASGRYWSTGGTALAFAVLGVLVMAFVIFVPDFMTSALLAFGLVTTAGGLPVAGIQLTRALRSGRGETFELYENGVARRASGVRKGWTWQEVAVLRAVPNAVQDTPPVTPIDRLVRRLGWHFHCSVRFTDGSRARIDGYAADGTALARTLLARCPDATTSEKTGGSTRIALVVLPLVAVAFAVPIVFMYRYLTATSAETLGDSMIVAAATGMVLCLIGLVISATAFVMMLVPARRSRS